MDSVKKYLCFRADTVHGWRYVLVENNRDYNGNTRQHISYSETPTDATKFDIEEPEKIIKARETFYEKNKDVDLELVNVEVVTRNTPVSMDQGILLELRQEKALKKLGVDDIRALGVEKTATYIKLRHHNVNER